MDNSHQLEDIVSDNSQTTIICILDKNIVSYLHIIRERREYYEF